MVAKIITGLAANLLGGFLARLATIRPWPPWMQYIPARAKSGVAARTWIVVTEAIDQFVPKGIKPCDEQRLA